MKVGKVIFIAVPSVGVVSNEKLTERFLRDMAKFHEGCPDIAFVSPMIQDYQLLPFLNKEPVWAEWGKRCEILLNNVDEVWVLMYAGWSESVGVNGEIACANSLGKPIFYIDPSCYVVQ